MGDLDLISLFFLGLLGTGHCIGMCGPLVVAFPGRTGRVAPHLFYHLGRLVTYGGIGAMMGGIGSGLAMVSSVTGSDHLQLVARVHNVRPEQHAPPMTLDKTCRERRVAAGRAERIVQLIEGGDEGLRDEPAAVGTEVPELIGF